MIFRVVIALIFLSGFCGNLHAQLPAKAPANSPAPPTTEGVLNSMSSVDLQQALQLLKSNYISPEMLSETEMNRALLSGLLQRLGRGATVLSERAPEATDTESSLYGEVMESHIGYLRLGALTSANLQALDAQLQKFAAKKIDALVIDLRASAGGDFALAADFSKRFVAKGKTLFTLRKTSNRQERVFISEADPIYRGLMLVLADVDTSGPAEAIGGVLRAQNKALVIGQPTAGQAVEFSDLPLNSGRVLRVAVAEAVIAESRPIFPGGLKPDLPVELATTEKRAIFQQAIEKGMAAFVFESERPHLNEAALLAGKNPELESADARRARGNDKNLPRDTVLQRAIDVVTSLAVYQGR